MDFAIFIDRVFSVFLILFSAVNVAIHSKLLRRVIENKNMDTKLQSHNSDAAIHSDCPL